MKRLFNIFNSTSTFGVFELTEEWVKVVYLRYRKNNIQTQFAKRYIYKKTDVQIGALIKGIIAELHIPKGSPFFLVISRRFFTVRNLKLPSLNEIEISSMVELQASKQLPYPSEDLIYDFCIIEQTRDGYSTVLLAMAHRNIIMKYISILEDASMCPDQVVISSEGLTGWLLAQKNLPLHMDISRSNFALVDIDSSFAEMVMYENGTLRLTRSFAYRSPNSPDQKDWFSRLLGEIQTTLYLFKKETSNSISSILLTGVEEKALTLKNAITDEIGIKDVGYIHPLRIVTVDYKGGLAGYFDQTKDVSFSSVLGVALGQQSLTLNFLPKEIVFQKRSRLYKRHFIRMGIVIFGIIFVIGLIGVTNFVYKSKQVKHISERLNVIKPQVRSLTKMKQIIDIVSSGIQMEGSSVDILREVYRVIPSNISLTVLDLDVSKDILIRGMADGLPLVLKFVNLLDKSVYFEEVTMKYASKRSVKGKIVIDFEIKARISRDL